MGPPRFQCLPTTGLSQGVRPPPRWPQCRRCWTSASLAAKRPSPYPDPSHRAPPLCLIGPNRCAAAPQAGDCACCHADCLVVVVGRQVLQRHHLTITLFRSELQQSSSPSRGIAPAARMAATLASLRVSLASAPVAPSHQLA
jgi:hypothetical protein